MNIEDIKGYLPHRPPMLLVDEAELIGDKVVGRYHVRGDEWFLQGHFPGMPVVPGVIQCEIIAQVGSLLVLTQEQFAGYTPLLAGLDKVRFRRRIVPGDTVTIECTLKKMLGPTGIGTGQLSVDGEVATTVDFSFALIKED